MPFRKLCAERSNPTANISDVFESAAINGNINGYHGSHL
jgi:hypothetical protein